MGPNADIRNFNPFPGLRPFSVSGSNLFFGREVEISEVYEKLLSNRFVTLIGSSGCGKTSLIQGGVMPLIRDHYLGGTSGWRVISFRPGNDPIGNLAAAIVGELSVAGQKEIDVKEVQSELFDNPEGIGAALRKFIVNPEEKVLLVIDQFEELFRLAARGRKEIVAASVAKFVGLLVEVIGQGGHNIFTIISLRSDFIGECSRYHGLTQLINNSNYLVPELDAENYRKAIEGPVNSSGATIDPQLVSIILGDLGGLPGQLPVLQHVMMRTWEQWKMSEGTDRPIGLIDYVAAGKLGGAISRHANEVFEELSPRGREICEIMFKTITERGPDNRGLRNPSTFNSIRYAAECSPEELSEVIEKFRMPARSFITPLPGVPLRDDTVIDLSQEIVIAFWDRLKEWVEEEAASGRMYLRLSDASAMYQQGKAGLLKPPDLQQLIDWRDRFRPTLRWAERYNPAFERAMVYLRTSEKKHIEDEENKIRLQKRRIRRIRIIASSLGVVTLISLGFMFMNMMHRMEAERMTKYAEIRMVLAVREKDTADSSVMMARLQAETADSNARMAIRIADEQRLQAEIAERKRVLAERSAAEALLLQKQASEKYDSAKLMNVLAVQNAKSLTEQKDEALRLRMLSVGKAMAVKSVILKGQNELQALLAFQAYLFNKKDRGFSNDADIYSGLYNVALKNGSNQIRSYKGHKGDVRSIAFIPGKNEFFTSGIDGQILKWSPGNGGKSFQVIYSGSDIIDVMAVSPDASWLACGSENSSIRMIPLKGNDDSFEMKGHSGKIQSLIFSSDSKQLYSAALDGKVLKWQISARTYTDVSTGSEMISSIDISSGGNYLAGLSNDGKVQVWDPGKKQDKFSIETTGKNIKVIKFNPGNNLLALGDSEGNVEIWDVSLRKKISQVKAHNTAVNDIRFNAMLKQMATAGNDNTIRIFNMTDPYDLTEPPVTFTDNEGIVLVIEFSPDGRDLIAGTSADERNLVSRPTHVDYLAPEACGYVSRNMTQEEWFTYVGKDIPFERTCPGKSYNIKIDQIR
jgi:WD40 repeat protein